VRPVPSPVPVEGEIRLGQFLKLAGAADSGADARALLIDGEVSVNGEPDTRRGRRLFSGDVVLVDLVDGPVAYRVTDPQV